MSPFSTSIATPKSPLGTSRRDWLAARRPSTAPISGKSSYDWEERSPCPCPSPTSPRLSTTSGRGTPGIPSPLALGVPFSPASPRPNAIPNGAGWKQGLGLGRLLARRPATSSGSAPLLAAAKVDASQRQEATHNFFFADHPETKALEREPDDNATPWLSRKYGAQGRPFTSVGGKYRGMDQTSAFLNVPPPVTSAFSDSEGVRTETATPAPPPTASPWAKARKYTRGLLSGAGAGEDPIVGGGGHAVNTGARGKGNFVIQGVREVFSSKLSPPNSSTSTMTDRGGAANRSVPVSALASETNLPVSGSPRCHCPEPLSSSDWAPHRPRTDQGQEVQRSSTIGSKRAFGARLLSQSRGRPATAAAALTSPRESLKTSPTSPPLLHSPSSTAPMSARTRDVRSTTPGLSGRSRSATCHSRMEAFDSRPSAAPDDPNTTSSRASSRCQLHSNPGPGEDFWVDDDGQMVFRILPEHNARLPLVTISPDVEVVKQADEDAVRIPKSCPIAPGYPLLGHQYSGQGHLDPGDYHPAHLASPAAAASPSLTSSSLSPGAKVTFGPLKLNKPLPPVSVSGRRSPKRKATHTCSTAPAAKVSRGYLLERSAWNKTTGDVAERAIDARKRTRPTDLETATERHLVHQNRTAILPPPPRYYIPHHQRVESETTSTPTTGKASPVGCLLRRSVSLEGIRKSEIPPPVPPKAPEPSSFRYGAAQHSVQGPQGRAPLRSILQRSHSSLDLAPRRPALQRSNSSLDFRAAGHKPHCQVYKVATRARSHSDLGHYNTHHSELTSSKPTLTSPESTSRTSSIRPHTSPSPSGRPLRGSRSLLNFRNGSFSELSPVLEHAELQDSETTSTKPQDDSQKRAELSDRIAHYLVRREEHRPGPIQVPPQASRRLNSFEGGTPSNSYGSPGRHNLPAPVFSTVTYGVPSPEQAAMLRPSYPISPLCSPSLSTRSHDADPSALRSGRPHRPSLASRGARTESSSGIGLSRSSLENVERRTPGGPLHQFFFGEERNKGVLSQNFSSHRDRFEVSTPVTSQCNQLRPALQISERDCTRLHAAPLEGITDQGRSRTNSAPANSHDDAIEYHQEGCSKEIPPLQRTVHAFSQYKKGDDLPGAKARRVLGLNKNAGWEIGEDATDDEELEALTAETGERNFFRIGRRLRKSLEEKESNKGLARRFGNKHGSNTTCRSAQSSAYCSSAAESTSSSRSLTSLRRPGSSTSDCSSLNTNSAQEDALRGHFALRPGSSSSSRSESERRRTPNTTPDSLASEVSILSKAKQSMSYPSPSEPATPYTSRSLYKMSSPSSSLYRAPLTPSSQTPTVNVSFTAPPYSANFTPANTRVLRQTALSPQDAGDVSPGKANSSRLDVYLRRLKPGGVSPTAARAFVRNHSLPSSALPRADSSHNSPTNISGVAVEVQGQVATSPMATVGMRDRMLWERTLENSQKDASWQSMIEHRPRAHTKSAGVAAGAGMTFKSVQPNEEQQSPLLGKGKHANVATFSEGVSPNLLLSTPTEWTRSNALSTDIGTPSTVADSSPASMLWSPEATDFRNRGFSPLTSPYDSDPEVSDDGEDDIYSSHASSVVPKDAGDVGSAAGPPLRCFSDEDNSPTLGYLNLASEKDYTSSEEGLEVLDERDKTSQDATESLTNSIGSPRDEPPFETLPLKVTKIGAREAEHSSLQVGQTMRMVSPLSLPSAQDAVESAQHSSSSCFSSNGECSSMDDWNKRTSSTSDETSGSETAHNTVLTSPECCTLLSSPKTPRREEEEREASRGHCTEFDDELYGLSKRRCVDRSTHRRQSGLSDRDSSRKAASPSEPPTQQRGWTLPVPHWRSEGSTDAFPMDIDEAEAELSDWERCGEDEGFSSAGLDISLSLGAMHASVPSYEWTARLLRENDPHKEEEQQWGEEGHSGVSNRRAVRRSLLLYPSSDGSGEEASEDEEQHKNDKKSGVVVIMPPLPLPGAFPSPCKSSSASSSPFLAYRRNRHSRVERPKTRHGPREDTEGDMSWGPAMEAASSNGL